MNDMRSSRVREQFYRASSLTKWGGRGGLRHTSVWESGEHGFTLRSILVLTSEQLLSLDKRTSDILHHATASTPD